MSGFYQKINRLLYAITLMLFLLHPLNIVYVYMKGRSFFGILANYIDYNHKTIALAALVIFPLYILLRWVLTGNFSFKPN